MVKVRILDRYIFQELVTPFFLSIGVLTFVLFLQKMFRLAELALSKGSSLIAVVKLLIYIMPGFLVITVPMSLLVASLTAFARMSSDSEITAMKASRISLYSMMRPVMFLALISLAATAITSLALLPAANQALKLHLFNMVKSRAMVGIEPGVFSSTFDGMVIYVDKMKSFDDMEGIFISDERSAKEPYAIAAKRGRLLADPKSFNVTLAMENGSVHGIPQNEQTYTLIAFTAARLYLDINHALLPKKTEERDFKETGTVELLRDLYRHKKEGKPTLNIESEFYQRLSIPFACLIFGLIGAPLGIRRSRSGRSASVAMAFAVFLIYYIILASGRNLAEAGKLSPAAAYWVPNILMAAAGAMFVVKKGREISLGISDRIAGTYRSLRAVIRGFRAR